MALTKSSVVPQTPDLVTGFGGLIESPDIKAEPPAVLSMRLVGANSTAEVTGLDQLPGITNYLADNDPAAWHTNIPTFSRVRYEEVYPGVDVVYYGNQRKLEYDFIVAPGFDPSVINMSFGGADELGLDGQVNLVVSVDSGQVSLLAPVIYQDSKDGRNTIPGYYTLIGDNGVGFQVSAYDRTLPSVIDPVAGLRNLPGWRRYRLRRRGCRGLQR